MAFVRGQQWQVYNGERPDPGAYMHGTLYVKDLSNNKHNQMFHKNNLIHASSNRHHHVEENLITAFLSEHRRLGKGQLQAAKITVAMRDSPCQQCYGLIHSWYEELRDALTPFGQLFLLFAFRQFYTTGNFGWRDEGTALENYEKLAMNSDRSLKTTKNTDLDGKYISNISFLYDSAATGIGYFIGYKRGYVAVLD